LKIVALYNIKGGVGKTAACVNLAYLAAAERVPTLLLDMDPQGSASFYFRIKTSKKFNTKKLLKGKKKIDKNIKGTDFDNLDLLASDISYRNLDIMLDDLKRSKKQLRYILAPFGSEYEYIFIDCPPNITLVSENIFFASHYLLVPLIPTTLSMLSYSKLCQFFINHSLPSEKILPFFSMVEKRKKMHREIMEKYHERNKEFLKTCIPFVADVEKMGIFRKPIVAFKPNSVASQAYQQLWQELKKMTQ
jgi:chromosome partitioning protein